MIGLLDCNNFFVSCERVFNPALNGKAVVVLSNNDGCVVSRSNEAKQAGIPMGLPAFKVKEYTNPNNVVMLSSNYTLYRDLSERVMSLVAEEVTNLQIYSIDETFFTSPYDDEIRNYEFFKNLVAKIKSYIGLPVSIGIAETRTLAKIASHIAKKTRQDQGSVYVIPSGANTEPILRNTPIEDIWGIGRRNSAHFRSYGVNNAFDLTQMPPSWVKNTFSINELRIQKELKGISCTSISSITEGRQTLTTSRSFGCLIKERQTLAQAIASFASNCAERLRNQQSAAQMVSVFIRGDKHIERLPFYANSCDIRLPIATSDTSYIVRYALIAFNNIFRDGMTYRKAGVILTQIVKDSDIQLNLFDSTNILKQRQLMKAIDSVNAVCGKGTIILGAEGGEKKWAARSQHPAKKAEAIHIFSGMRYSQIDIPATIDTGNSSIK